MPNHYSYRFGKGHPEHQHHQHSPLPPWIYPPVYVHPIFPPPFRPDHRPHWGHPAIMPVGGAKTEAV